jgi:hypothetical protein
MNTATLSPPPRPPRTGNIRGGLGEPDRNGPRGGRTGFSRWWRMGAKLLVAILLVIVITQLAVILFRTVRLWFFA